MKLKTHRGPIVLGLLVSLFAGLALVAMADDQQPITMVEQSKAEQATNEEKVAALEAAETTTPQVYHMNGMTIAWDSEAKAFGGLTAEQTKLMAEHFNKLVEAKFAGTLMPREDAVVVEEMESGLRRARLPVSQLTASVVRTDENGNFVVSDCAEGAEKTGLLLKEPVRSNQLEEK
jgi:hypothetical protein